MSNLPGNQFAEDHDEMYHNIGQTVVSEEGQTDATLIWSAIENHATATLALAYEQRTANLIALLDTPAGRLTIMREGDHAMDAVQGEIRDRLGMRAEK